MFRGVIKAGSNVRVKFSSNFSNQGAAHLLVSNSAFAGGSTTDSATTPPGGIATVQLDAVVEGTLELLLDVAVESDSGTLEVFVNEVSPGPVPVMGDQRWTWSVEA